MMTNEQWKIPSYSKKQVKKAGITVLKPDVDKDEYNAAIEVIDDYRAAHAYPLHVFYMNLRNKKGSRDDIIVARRLKRLSSILNKLEVQPYPNLKNMQDIGGCRMILPSVSEVFEYAEKLKKSRIRHIFINEDDYINKPRESGYRSLHHIYSFQSRSDEKKSYNNMRIEIQFRSHLQHLWSTAVEMMGTFNGRNIKGGQGTPEEKRFFALTSSLFAIEEGYPIVPNTPDSIFEIVNELKMLESKYQLLEKLEGVRAAFTFQELHEKADYCLLILHLDLHKLEMIPYKQRELESATEAYNYYESLYLDSPVDVVLVSASSISELKKAYPNYFLDSNEFEMKIGNYLQ